MLREHDDAGAGMVLTQPLRDLDPLGRVRRGHADVEDHDVNLVLLEECLELLAVASGGDHLQVSGGIQDRPGALAHEIVVLGDQQSCHHADAPFAERRSPSAVQSPA